jgi:hypothetical protein
MRKPAVQSCQPKLFDAEPVPLPPKQRSDRSKQETDFAFDLTDALRGPVLTFSTSWADTIPRRLLDIIPMARLIAVKEGEPLATYPEVAVYIYTRSLEAPMDAEWADIYTHVSCTTLQQHFQEDHWQEVKAPRQLSAWLQSKLRDLQKHIYDKRREMLKKQLKAQPPKAKTSREGPEPDLRSQPSLFP